MHFCTCLLFAPAAEGESIQASLMPITGSRTVPQVFIGGKYIGGNSGACITFQFDYVASQLACKEFVEKGQILFDLFVASESNLDTVLATQQRNYFSDARLFANDLSLLKHYSTTPSCRHASPTRTRSPGPYAEGSGSERPMSA